MGVVSGVEEAAVFLLRAEELVCALQEGVEMLGWAKFACSSNDPAIDGMHELGISGRSFGGQLAGFGVDLFGIRVETLSRQLADCSRHKIWIDVDSVSNLGEIFTRHLGVQILHLLDIAGRASCGLSWEVNVKSIDGRVLLDSVNISQQAIFSHHSPLLPCSFVFGQDFISNVSTVPDVVDSHCSATFIS